MKIDIKKLDLTLDLFQEKVKRHILNESITLTIMIWNKRALFSTKNSAQD